MPCNSYTESAWESVSERIFKIDQYYFAEVMIKSQVYCFLHVYSV